jgi:hypothetical protein
MKVQPSAPKAAVYLALLHYPVYDKNHQVVTTAVTNMDIHDIARRAAPTVCAAFMSFAVKARKTGVENHRPPEPAAAAIT